MLADLADQWPDRVRTPLYGRKARRPEQCCYSSHSAWQQDGVLDGEYLFRLVYKAQHRLRATDGIWEAEPQIDLSRR